MRRTAAALVVMLVAATAPAAAGRLDHLVLGAADLEAAVRQFRELTGIEPVFGGRHPGAGTQNALVSLGEGAYVEIIAPVPGAQLSPMLPDLTSFERLTPLMWAVGVDDAGAAAERLGAAGFGAFGPAPGSRQLPEGGLLEWRLVAVPFANASVPFFIEWSEGSAHPSTTSPAGCSLVSMSVTDPDAGKLEALLRRFDLAVEVEQGEAPGLRFALDCPGGRVEFGSAG